MTSVTHSVHVSNGSFDSCMTLYLKDRFINTPVRINILLYFFCG